MPNVNLYDGSINPEPVHTLALVDVLDHIQQGTYQAAVERVRKILHTQGQDAYNETKRALPAATFCGTFAPTRAKANLQAHSGVIHGDIDHLQDKDDLAAKKQRLRVDPFTVYLFESPSATGLKVGLHVNRLPDDASYKHAWQAAADYHRAQYGIVWDRSGKDIGRLCYVSWDPDLYRNLDAPLFPVPPLPEPKPAPTRVPFDVPRNRRERYARQAIETAVAMIDGSSLGNRHHARLRASELLGGYIGGGILSESEAYDALKEAVARNTKHPDRSMKTIAAGLQHGQERPITLEELEAERQAWLTAQGYRDRPMSPSIALSSAPGSPNAGAPYRPYRGYRGYHAYRGYGREVPHG